MNLPTLDEVKELYKKYECYENIIEHMLAVGKFAKIIAEHLKEKGFDIDPELMEKAGFLHDIAKTKCLKEDCHHAIEGFNILEKEGYPEIARITRAHTGDIIFEENGEKKWLMQPIEEKVLATADGHILENKIVSLKDRFKYLYERYPEAKDKLDKLILVYRKFEIVLKENANFDINNYIE